MMLQILELLRQSLTALLKIRPINEGTTVCWVNAWALTVKDVAYESVRSLARGPVCDFGY